MKWKKSSFYVSPRPYHSLAFRIKGNAVFSHNKNTLSASPGGITYMPADYDYYADYTDENEIYVIHFKSDVKAEFENYSPMNSILFNSLFGKAVKLWNEPKESFYFKTMSIYYDILSELSSITESLRYRDSYKNFLVSLEYMRNNFTNPELSIDSLVKMANMSNTYFRKLFVETIGSTPSIYLTTLRLQHAERLLSSGMHTIENVAYLSGFNDSKYFSRVVKKVYGCSPSHLYIKKYLK